MDDNQALNKFKELLGGYPPELGPGPRAGVLPATALDRILDELFAGHKPPGHNYELIRGLALLWHDHHEPAHEIAQSIDNADGSLLHAILHRREPDYGNAAYWFRRVGKHPCFMEISRRAAELASVQIDKAWREQLLFIWQAARNGDWDPFAFIQACEATSQLAPSDPRVLLLQQIQVFESEAFLEHLFKD